MRISGVLALVFLCVFLGSMVGVGGGAFLNAPAFHIVAGLAAALSLLSFGFWDCLCGLGCLLLLVLKKAPFAVGPRHALIVKGMIVHLYAAGGVAVLVGAMQMLRQLDDPGKIGVGVAMCLLPVLYAALLAEFLFRPALHRVASLLVDEQGEGQA